MLNHCITAETQSQCANASTSLTARPASHFNPSFDLLNPVMPGSEQGTRDQ